MALALFRMPLVQRVTRNEAIKMFLLGLVELASCISQGALFSDLLDLCRHLRTLLLNVAHSLPSVVDHRCQMPEKFAISRRRVPRSWRHIPPPGLFEHLSQLTCLRILIEAPTGPAGKFQPGIGDWV